MFEKRTLIRQIFKENRERQEVTVMGWVRTFRNNQFITLSDGSCIHLLQVVIDANNIPENILQQIHTGSSIQAIGDIIPSLGKGQQWELKAKKINILGGADPAQYPLQPKKHSLEFLREIAHLRCRTQTFGSIFRVRHHLSFAIHQFFHEQGFFYLHAPIITANDCEGAGEMFEVSTLSHLNPPLTADKQIDYKEDFFGKRTHLTVSGQLEAELVATALGKVYTFGPTFRAENSNTTRHLAEFWMIEPEMAFADLEDDMNLAEQFIKYILSSLLTHCSEDLSFLSQRQEEEEKQLPQDKRTPLSLIDKLSFVRDQAFERITYTNAIDILLNSNEYKKKKFAYPVSWGIDLQSEHERFLVEKHFKKPVIVTNYPKDIKAFYMRSNDDGKTVAAMDILAPGIGEIVGGSQREERLDMLTHRMKDMKIPLEELNWYLDIRRFGTVPHAGFGLGFERIVQFATGMSNIRDVIPFARTPKNCEF